MPNENSRTNAQIAERIEQARELLAEVLALVKNTGARAASSKKAPTTRPRTNYRALDFSMPIRAFVKQYGRNMNGSEKFTLLVAYLTKGDATKRVRLAEVEKHWNRMTAKGLLGVKFNRLYTSQARENDWANTEKTGSYHLRPAWKEIFR